MPWRWLTEAVVLAIHDEQLAEHGGAAGIRDPALLQSTLARPQNLAACGYDPGLADLAAAYAFGLVRNQSTCKRCDKASASAAHPPMML